MATKEKKSKQSKGGDGLERNHIRIKEIAHLQPPRITRDDKGKKCRKGEYAEKSCLEDFAFKKIWLCNMSAEKMAKVLGQKTGLLFWLFAKANKVNEINLTQEQISKKSGISLRVVQRTMPLFDDLNYVKKISHGRYMVNPGILFNGDAKTRAIALSEYGQIK